MCSFCWESSRLRIEHEGACGEFRIFAHAEIFAPDPHKSLADILADHRIGFPGDKGIAGYHGHDCGPALNIGKQGRVEQKDESPAIRGGDKSVHLAGHNEENIAGKQMVGGLPDNDIVIVLRGHDDLQRSVPVIIVVDVLLIAPDADGRAGMILHGFIGVFDVSAACPVVIDGIIIQNIIAHYGILHSCNHLLFIITQIAQISNEKIMHHL